jgi:hypothetical protein
MSKHEDDHDDHHNEYMSNDRHPHIQDHIIDEFKKTSTLPDSDLNSVISGNLHVNSIDDSSSLDSLINSRPNSIQNKERSTKNEAIRENNNKIIEKQLEKKLINDSNISNISKEVDQLISNISRPSSKQNTTPSNTLKKNKLDEFERDQLISELKLENERMLEENTHRLTEEFRKQMDSMMSRLHPDLSGTIYLFIYISIYLCIYLCIYL